MFPGPDILQLLPPFDLSKLAEVDLRDGGSPAGKTSFAPGGKCMEVVPVRPVPEETAFESLDGERL
jgi:hypothetical protein